MNYMTMFRTTPPTQAGHSSRATVSRTPSATPLQAHRLSDGSLYRFDYQNRAFMLGACRIPHEGWWYARSDRSVGRFAARDETCFRGEEFPDNEYRFPHDNPLYVKDVGGHLWEVAMSNAGRTLFIAHDPDSFLFPNPLGTFGKYTVLTDTGDGCREAQYAQFSHTSKLRETFMPHAEHPMKIWETLPLSNPSLKAPTASVPDRIDVEALVHGSTLIPSRARTYRIFHIDYEGHRIACQLPAEEISYLPRLHQALRATPLQLLKLITTVTIVPRNISKRLDYVARLISKGHIALTHEWDSTRRYPPEDLIAHEAMHNFTSMMCTEHTSLLGLLVGAAAFLDGRTGWRDYGATSWKEALAISVEIHAKGRNGTPPPDTAIATLALDLIRGTAPSFHTTFSWPLPTSDTPPRARER